jgi:hypothetical protein
MGVSAAIFFALDFVLFGVLHLPQLGVGFSLISVFAFLPAVAIGGMPWVLLVIKKANFNFTLATAFAGFLLNFSLFGLIIGFPDPFGAARALLGRFHWSNGRNE